jgi:transcriptional regulator with XRE-family HTH domain
MSESEFNRQFARRMCAYMDKLQLTQQGLADKLGVSPAAVSHWCTGKKVPRMDRVDQICKIFRCRRTDLVSEAGATDSVMELTELEWDVITNYRLADAGTRMAVNKLLDVTEKKSESVTA